MGREKQCGAGLASNLILVQDGVADPCHEHHRDQERNKSLVGHLGLRENRLDCVYLAESDWAAGDVRADPRRGPLGR